MDAFLNYLPIIVVTALMAFLFAQSKKEKTILWDQISQVKYAVQRRELRIFSSNQKIIAPLHLVGFPQLIKEIEVKTGESLAHLNIPK
ncbi:hypothetical protein [Gilvibacter sp.]|uniref:hypothetical protein n=1 Tax=Gilvibacter sp. TaxID=2729997 RepID=UPI0025C4CE09|nr:hypothetical protein [Gilvibacter sp.]NQX76438.1 hypothetical protein [Gilvibacter sp.]